MRLFDKIVRRAHWTLAAPAALAAAAFMAIGAAPAPKEVSPALWRLDCGTIEVGNLNDYSDNYRYVGEQKTFTDSCYLIRSGERYLLWDTGLPGELAGSSKEEGGDRMALK